MSEREFVVINEEAARTAQNMMSFNEYQPGTRTKEYQEDVNEVYDLAEEVVARRGEEYRERAWRLATRYAKNLGKYFNEVARIGCMCPSVMISGASYAGGMRSPDRKTAPEAPRIHGSVRV